MEESKSTNGEAPLSLQKAPTIQFGLTEPISFVGRSKSDIHRNAMLEKFLITSEVYEAGKKVHGEKKF